MIYSTPVKALDPSTVQASRDQIGETGSRAESITRRLNADAEIQFPGMPLHLGGSGIRLAASGQITKLASRIKFLARNIKEILDQIYHF